MKSKRNYKGLRAVEYFICILLAVLSIFPFWIMIVNATRSTTQIQQHAISLIPSTYAIKNFMVLTGKSFNPAVGFMNSLIVSGQRLFMKNFGRSIRYQRKRYMRIMSNVL